MKKKKEVSILQKTIEKRNNEFKNASKAQKRVMIAEDVILHINSKKFIPESGDYLNTNEHFNKVSSEKELANKEEEEVKPLLLAPKFQCNVCAIGAMFVSDVISRNSCSIDDFTSTFAEGMRERLKKYFSHEQLDMIESAFEGNDMISAYEYDTSNIKFVSHKAKCKRAVAWSDDIREKAKLKKDETMDEHMMVRIMKNIIANNGTFRIR